MNALTKYRYIGYLTMSYLPHCKLFCSVFVLFCFVLFCFVLVWFGLVWFGLVWFGLVWFSFFYFVFSFSFLFLSWVCKYLNASDASFGRKRYLQKKNRYLCWWCYVDPKLFLSFIFFFFFYFLANMLVTVKVTGTSHAIFNQHLCL